MNQTGKAVSWSVWIGVALTAILLALAMFLLKVQRTGPPQILHVIGSVPAFTLTNQLSQPVTRDDLKGRVWIADIIFTRCAGPCPVMTIVSSLNPYRRDLIDRSMVG